MHTSRVYTTDSELTADAWSSSDVTICAPTLQRTPNARANVIAVVDKHSLTRSIPRRETLPFLDGQSASLALLGRGYGPGLRWRNARQPASRSRSRQNSTNELDAEPRTSRSV